jgi:hypothetical protein
MPRKRYHLFDPTNYVNFGEADSARKDWQMIHPVYEFEIRPVQKEQR